MISVVALPELNDSRPKKDLTTVDIGEPAVAIPEIEARFCTVLERYHSSFQGDGNAVPGPTRAKRPPTKNGGELGGGDPRASAYLMNTLRQGLPEGALGQADQCDADQSRRPISRKSLASGDATSKLARPGRAEGEAEIAKAEPENGPASDESEPEVVSRVMIEEGTTTHGAQKELAKVFEDQPFDFVAEPVSQLKASLARCMRLEIDFSDRAEVIVYFLEDTELLLDFRNESAALPELKNLNPKADLTTTDIGEPGVMTEAMGVQTRAILAKYHDSFLGDGNVVPGPARGVIYDLNVNDANGVAQRSRPIRLELVWKVYDLLEQRFQTELIKYSHLEWASRIVIVMKKIGVDIGICIGHRSISQPTKLLHYPQPLIDDLLIGFKGALSLGMAKRFWTVPIGFKGALSLGMAKRFWTVPMTLRAKHISAIICLLGYFQRKRRLLSLKKAPLIYRRMLGDCLWGFVCSPASEEAQVDAGGLAFLGISVGDSAHMGGFPKNVPASPQLKLVREESSYIGDISYGSETWKQLCVELDRLLYRLRCWVTPMSLLKNKLGKKMISCLSHQIEADRIQAQPKIAKSVKNIPSPSTLKGVQSLSASLNYCNEFTNSLQVIAAVLNKMTDEQIRSGRDLGRAMEAFGILKHKIVSTPLLRHQDSQKAFVIIIHANPRTACAALGQESDGVIFPVHIAERVLRGHELRDHPAENEVVALIRALRVFRTMLAGTKPIKVYTRYSLLEWISTSRWLEGRCRQWAVRLAPWSLEIIKIQQDGGGLAAIMGAEVTPRDKLDQNADSLIPAIGHVIRTSPVRLEMLGPGYEGWLISFDGDAKKSDRWSSAECIIWKLLSWDEVQARGFRLADVAVNEAEYRGMIEGSKMALERGISEVVIVGDPMIVIQQAESLIQCLKPMLRMLLSEFKDRRQKSKSIELANVKRGSNAAADYLTSKIWTTRHSDFINNPVELDLLRRLSCNAGKLISDQKSTQAEPDMEPCSVPDANVDVVRGRVSLAQTDKRFSPKSETFVITRSCTRAEETPAEVEVVDPGSNVRDAAETAELQARFISMQAGDELPEPNAQ